MTIHHSGGGACMGKPINYDDEFDKQMNAMRYRADGTSKTKNEIRKEMNTFRSQLGLPTRHSPKTNKKHTSPLRRSERIREQSLRRSTRIKEQNKRNTRVTKGGKKRRRKTRKHSKRTIRK